MAHKIIDVEAFYRITEFIKDCPDYEPLTEYEEIETILNNEKTKDNDQLQHLR